MVSCGSRGLSLNSQRCLEDFFCSSRQRSLIAVCVDRRDTEGFMQSCFRDASGMCFTSSSVVEAGSGYVGGKCGRESSPTNWESWECVLDA
jgi:hypothetical protein